MEETLDQISPLNPLDFFLIEADLYPISSVSLAQPLKKKWLLPATNDLSGERSFAEVYAGWHQKGIRFSIDVYSPFADVVFPDFRKGDSIELFIDTRDRKTAGFPTQFCHHFVFFPKPLDGVVGREVTKFRTEDRHDLAGPELFKLTGEFSARKYSVQIFLPSEVLSGYDPNQFQKLGFSYRINRTVGSSQHFSDAEKGISLEQHPSRWATLNLRA